VFKKNRLILTAVFVAMTFLWYIEISQLMYNDERNTWNKSMETWSDGPVIEQRGIKLRPSLDAKIFAKEQ
jgi:hypothetical protein